MRVISCPGYQSTAGHNKTHSMEEKPSYYLPDWVKEQNQPWDGSKILDFLWLSDYCTAAMLERLQEIKITHILVACWETRQWFPETFQYMQLSVADSHTEPLITHFDETCKFIENAKTNGGNILIHCMGGVSRSPTIVAAYLMKSMGLGHEEAITFIRERRRVACPNQNFRMQLKLYGNLGCELKKKPENKHYYKEFQQLVKSKPKKKKEAKDEKCTVS